MEDTYGDQNGPGKRALKQSLGTNPLSPFTVH